MAESERLERQWLILRTLCTRRNGVTVRELADRFSVGVKTIRRDLLTLQGLGFPIAPLRGERMQNRWIATSDPHALPLSFDLTELLGLYLGRTLAEPLAGTCIWMATQSAFRKIRASLNEPALAYLAKLQEIIHRTSFRESDYRDKSDFIDALMLAIENGFVVLLVYRSLRAAQASEYSIQPYGMIYHRGSLYLIAHSIQHDELRHFKLDRVQQVVVSERTFVRPSEFELSQHLRHSLGIFHGDGPPQTIRIRFSPQTSRYVNEHRWHPSQTIRPCEDGGVELSMELNTLEEVRSWILSFGSHAVVLEPLELREQILNEARAMLNGDGRDGFSGRLG